MLDTFMTAFKHHNHTPIGIPEPVPAPPHPHPVCAFADRVMLPSHCDLAYALSSSLSHPFPLSPFPYHSLCLLFVPFSLRHSGSSVELRRIGSSGQRALFVTFGIMAFSTAFFALAALRTPARRSIFQRIVSDLPIYLCGSWARGWAEGWK